MENSNPKLKFFLAKSALIHFYNNSYWTNDEIHILRNFFRNNDSERMWKLKMRLLCEENNDMLVGAVVADANAEEQIFLHKKYRLNWSFVKIGMELHIHPNGLQRWRDKFLAEIASLLEYNLPTTDIFSRNKVEALIYVLERTITFHEEFSKFDEKVLAELKFKLEVYQNLLFAIKQILALKSDKLGYRIIRAKILNPHMSVEELESYIGTSHTTIANYVHYFQKQFFKKINFDFHNNSIYNS